MRNSNLAANEKNQRPYSRRRDHPQFDGMKGKDSNLAAQGNTFTSQEDMNSSSSLARSLFDIWELESKKSATYITHNGTIQSENSELDSELKSLQRALSVRTSNFDLPTGSLKLDKADILVDDKTPEMEKQEMYNVDNKKNSHSKIFLPKSAASYYDENSLRTNVSPLPLCEGIDRLNEYLKARKADLNAGVPGRFLHTVIGQEVADVGSVVSTIMYAFYLNENQESNQLCVVPIINMKRGDLSMHNELKWLLHSCCVDESYLVFIDEIDLSYYDLFGNLKLVLVNGHRLSSKQEGLKEALVEIFNCKEVDSQYPLIEKVTMSEDCSCCTLLTEMFVKTFPEILAGLGFSRLLLSGIILDTANLTDANCTSKDKYMATLLIKGAGRFGCSGFYQLLKHKMFDVSELMVRDVLRKDFKKWTRVAGKPSSAGRLTVSHIGMSSVGISVEQLLAHEDSAAQEVTLFQKSEKLQLLMIVSGYYDSQKNFKVREILVSTNTAELMRNFLDFLNENGRNLPLKALDQPGLTDQLKAFEVHNKLTSRRNVERLLAEFGGVLRQQ